MPGRGRYYARWRRRRRIEDAMGQPGQGEYRAQGGVLWRWGMGGAVWVGNRYYRTLQEALGAET